MILIAQDTVATDQRRLSAESFKEGGGVVGVRAQRYMASYLPTD